MRFLGQYTFFENVYFIRTFSTLCFRAFFKKSLFMRVRFLTERKKGQGESSFLCKKYAFFELKNGFFTVFLGFLCVIFGIFIWFFERFLWFESAFYESVREEKQTMAYFIKCYKNKNSRTSTFGVASQSLTFYFFRCFG